MYEKLLYEDHGEFGRYNTSGVFSVALHLKKVGCDVKFCVIMVSTFGIFGKGMLPREAALAVSVVQ
jgi:hypothetical protein